MATVPTFSWPSSLQDGYPRVQPSNFVEKGLLWLHDKDVSMRSKVGAVALGIIVGLGISLLGASLVAAYPVLGFTLLVLPALPAAIAIIMNTLLKFKAMDEIKKMCSEQVRLALGVQEKFEGIPDAGSLWNKIPKLKRTKEVIQDARNYFHLLRTEDFSAPLMTGRDLWRNRILAFKLRKKNEKGAEPFMAFYCKRFDISRYDSEGFCWKFIGFNTERLTGQEKDSFSSLTNLHEIVVTKNHSHFELAE